jgi:hypothetical protein
MISLWKDAQLKLPLKLRPTSDRGAIMTRLNSPLLAAIAIAVMVGFASPTVANEYPWCAQYAGGLNGGGRNCGFVSYAQCMETIRGMGGFCERNLFYTGVSGQGAKRLRR